MNPIKCLTEPLGAHVRRNVPHNYVTRSKINNIPFIVRHRGIMQTKYSRTTVRIIIPICGSREMLARYQF